MSNSREYAKFKRLFIGPSIPKKIKKERGIGYAPAMPGIKIDRADKKWRVPRLDKTDWRCVRNGKNISKLVRPLWANKDIIVDIYAEAKHLTKTTNIKHEVDHIIPLRHPLVCGLHVEYNLRIITQEQNKQKDNLFS
jgi:hypothetical protein